MRIVAFFVLGFVTVSNAAVPEQFWFLLPLRAHHALVVVAGSTAQRVKDFGGDVRSYGQSSNAIAFVSAQQNGSEFDVIDKSSRQLMFSMPISDRWPPAWMRGPAPTLMLTDRAAFFITYDVSNGQPVRNDGAFYSLTEVSLPDGYAESYPLPKECLNPSVSSFEGMPLVYGWDADCIVTFDPASKTLRPRLSLQDLADILAKEKQALRARTIPSNAVSSFVVVPDAGIYRVSKLGTLDAVLDASLRPVQQPRISLKLTPPESVWVTLPDRCAGQPAMAVIPANIRAGQSGQNFQCIDARSLTVKWSVDLPAEVVPASIQPAAGNAVTYVNRSTATLDEISPEKTQTLLSLSSMQSLVSPDDGPFALAGATLVLRREIETP